MMAEEKRDWTVWLRQQRRIVTNVSIGFILVLGFIGLVFDSIYLITTRAITFNFVYYVVSYLAVLILMLVRRIPDQWRSFGFLALLYVFGTLALYSGWLAGGGRSFLLALIVLAVVLENPRVGFVAAGLSLITYIVFGFAFNKGWVTMRQLPDPTSTTPIVLEGVGFAIVIILISIGLWYFGRALMAADRANGEAQEARALLDERARQLESANALIAEQAGRLRAESESRFHVLFDRAPAAIVISGPAGGILEVNDAFLQMIGYSREEVIGRTVQGLGLWVDPSEQARTVAGMEQDGCLAGFQFSFRRKSGEVGHGEMWAEKITLEGEECWISSTLDITERKRIEIEREDLIRELEAGIAERRRADEILKKKAEEMSFLYRAGVALTGSQNLYSALRALVKELCRMIQVDAMYVGIYDSRTNVISFPLWLSFDEDVEMPSYSLNERQGLTSEVIATCKTLYLHDIQDPEIQKSHRWIVHRDIGVRTYLGIPLFVEDRIIGILSVQAQEPDAYSPDQIRLLETLASQVAIVIERDLSREQLAASEERYRLISEVSSDYTFSTRVAPDGSLHLEWVAGAFETITGYTFEEYVERGGWRAALHPDDMEQDAKDLACLRANQPVVSEIRTIAKDGIVHWVRVYAHPVWDAENARLAGIYGAVQDVTERRRIETEREDLIHELEAKNAELERFTYTVSHDLKSPLITIQGFLGYLEKDASSGNMERLHQDVERINHAAAKMQDLLNDLLELSRIGRLMNPPVDVPFETIVRDALALTEGRLRERGVRVEVDPHLPIVHGDAPRLVEVIQNLIDNAAKFMGGQPEPLVHIGVTQVSGESVFFVRDNGIGIEPQFQSKVFGLFNKLDPRSEGTGVGLALVKRIIEVHGGKIWLESMGAGLGTTFYFTLPSRPGNISRAKD